MADYPAEVLADSPLLYVRFEETSGATCANSGSLGGNATAAGTYTRNISTGLAGVGVGIDVDGSSGVVTYPNDTALDLVGTDMTYECWINPDISQNHAFMGKGQSSGGAGSYRLEVDTSRVIRATNMNGGWVILGSATGAYTVGSWTHIAFTRTGNNYVLYVNGSSFTTATETHAVATNGKPFTIGANWFDAAATDFFNGKIDEVAVYNTALSAARIAAHYAARSTAPAAPSTFVPQIVIT